MSDLKKIQFNLYPDEYEGDRVTLDAISDIRQKERGRAYRAFLLAGATLYKLDRRLPYLLAELLNDDTSLRDVQSVMSSVLPGSFNHDLSGLNELLSNLGAVKAGEPAAKPEGESAEIPQKDDTLSEKNDHMEETRQNAMKMFGDD